MYGPRTGEGFVFVLRYVYLKIISGGLRNSRSHELGQSSPLVRGVDAVGVTCAWRRRVPGLTVRVGRALALTLRKQPNQKEGDGAVANPSASTASDHQ